MYKKKCKLCNDINFQKARKEIITSDKRRTFLLTLVVFRACKVPFKMDLKNLQPCVSLPIKLTFKRFLFSLISLVRVRG